MNTNEIEILAAQILKMQEEKNEELRRNSDWKEGLTTDSKGKIENNIENYLYYFNNSPIYANKLKYNDFLKQKEYDGKEWTDFDEAVAMNNIEKDTKLTTNFKVKNAVDEIFITNKYNPVQEYLNSCSWDGVERIEEVFIKCFDINDTQLVRTLSKKWFIAAVKRVFEPGCQFDNMIVLQGRQGIGKTTFCRNLAKGFYSEIKFDEISNKDIVDKLNKSWVAIIDEMDNFNTKGMASIKSFLSLTQDTVRLAYNRNTTTYKRHCIFIGSLNDETFLKDLTSSVERRFWIFKCNKTSMDSKISEIMNQEYVSQLWGEAMYYYKSNPDIYLDVDGNIQKDFAEDQLQYKNFNTDVMFDYIDEILNKEYTLVDGKFNDDNDFLRQFRDENVYCSTKSYINKIKMSSLVYVLKEVYHIDRYGLGKYIGEALESTGEWEYKDSRWGSKTFKSLIRKNTIDTQNINNEIVNDLPL